MAVSWAGVATSGADSDRMRPAAVQVRNTRAASSLSTESPTPTSTVLLAVCNCQLHTDPAPGQGGHRRLQLGVRLGVLGAGRQAVPGGQTRTGAVYLAHRHTALLHSAVQQRLGLGCLLPPTPTQPQAYPVPLCKCRKVCRKRIESRAGIGSRPGAAQFSSAQQRPLPAPAVQVTRVPVLQAPRHVRVR